jgi:hypothetical protein
MGDQSTSVQQRSDRSQADLDDIVATNRVDLSKLTPAQIDELGYLLRERAARQRKKLSVEEARAAVQGAKLSDAWLQSRLVDVGRIRAAAKELRLAGLLPEQFAESLAQVGLEDAFPNVQIIANAIAAGISDAVRLL